MTVEKQFEQRPNTGSLFAKKSKTKPTSPDYFGEALIDLSQYEIVNNQIKVSIGGWKRVSKTGKQFLSLALSAPYENSGSHQRAYNPVPQSDNDDDCPF